MLQHEVVVVEHLAQLGCEALAVEKVLYAQRAPGDLVFVGRPDPPPGRADLVLAALGGRLAAAFPSEALTARVGEDEFAVLTPRGRPGPEEVLRQALEQPLRISGLDIHPTLSLGAVEVPSGEGADAAELLGTGLAPRLGTRDER
jgi:hypothetical protein